MGHCLKSEETVSRRGIGQFASGKALNRMKHTPVHCKAVCSQHVGKRPITRKRSQWGITAGPIPDYVRLGKFRHFSQGFSPPCQRPSKSFMR